MLTLTENAATIIKNLATGSESAALTAGLRIFAEPSSGTEFSVEIATAPAAGDTEVEADGARVYLDEAGSTALANKQLDATVDSDGVRFSLRNQS